MAPLVQSTPVPAGCGDPFVVSGTLHGEARAVSVDSPEQALRVAAQWCVADKQAVGSWQLRADYPEPVVMIARQAPGLGRETQRVAHVFEFEPGVAQRDHLRARCGARLPLLQAEWLSVGSGMPCSACLVAHMLNTVA